LINGVDDLLAQAGPEKVLQLFNDAPPAPEIQQTQAQMLIELAAEAELLHTAQDEGYARVAVNGHHEIWILRSKGFRQWLLREFYRTHGKPPGAQALQDAIGVLEAKARFEGREQSLAIRVAEHGGNIYFDLCNSRWGSVEITPAGWTVISDSPVNFRRSKGMLELPQPERGGTLELLRKHINVGDDSNWILCASWLVASCWPKGPYPLLILQGEQGSAKSSMERILRRVIDPSVAPVRTPPRDERDLLIAANNSWVIAYDNLSGIPHWLSDALCRLATGGGFSTRELYSDSEEIFFHAQRPVILNGIDQLAERADLADRSIVLNLPRIAETDRKDEAQLYVEFEQSLPKILGALFDALSSALARIGELRLERKPRMADFALRATAAEQALGFGNGAFMERYAGNRAEAVQETLDADPVASAIQSFLESIDDTHWEGSCKELLERLKPVAGEAVQKTREWPRSPRGLSSRLRRLVTFLREAGIEVTFPPRGTSGHRTVVITKNGREFDRH